ncbi:transposase [Streptomyces phaeochromogenes]|uniref:transposase n=1 Tax=Streptomyces phaeochromogenes TaxID=1923 RepID=UPI00386F461C|nr:transposase [Streptomyces phaeochromogenes]
MAGAGMPGVQRLQFFLSESPWEAEQVNDRRLELLRGQPETAPHDGGVIVIGDSGDRKAGTATANVGRLWLGRLALACRAPALPAKDREGTGHPLRAVSRPCAHIDGGRRNRV